MKSKKKVAAEIFRISNVIRKKNLMLKSDKQDFQRDIEKNLNPIVQPLNKIVQRIESNEKNQKEINENFVKTHKEKNVIKSEKSRKFPLHRIKRKTQDVSHIITSPLKRNIKRIRNESMNKTIEEDGDDKEYISF